MGQHGSPGVVLNGYRQVGWLLWPWEDTMANIWDRFGRLIGSVERSGNGDADTYDEKGQPLGRVTKLGTYEIRGNKISSERDPGANIREKEVAQETSKKVGIGTRLVEVKPKWGGG